MPSAAPARSTSSDTVGAFRRTVVRTAALMGATAVAIGRTRIMELGLPGYVLTWLSLPLLELVLLAFIYRNDRELLEYAVVAGAGLAMLFGLIFNGGEILDNERRRGTLGNLFLAPVSRYVWLGGFQLFALIETIANAAIAVIVGAWLFSVPMSVNVPSLLVTVVLLTAALWGTSLILGAIGIVTRNANFFSNLIFPLLALFAGTLYPIALMPDWIRIPARALPFGYGIEALVGALARNASVVDLWPTLTPLAGFAVALPLIGIVMFRWMERAVRRIGSLEIA